MIGYVYKIESNCGTITYIGSTTKSLKERFKKHLSQTTHTISPLLKNGQYSFPRGCELLGEYDIIDRYHLCAYEQLWINKIKKCINKMPAFGLLKEERKANYNKIYMVGWEERNKEKRTKKWTCECGGSYTSRHKNDHLKTKKHISFLASIKTA